MSMDLTGSTSRLHNLRESSLPRENLMLPQENIKPNINKEQSRIYTDNIKPDIKLNIKPQARLNSPTSGALPPTQKS